MTLRVPILNLPAQHQQIGAIIEKSVIEVLRSGNYILSENVKRLEEEIATICGCRHGVGVANGTDALVLALWSLDVGPGDEVITTPFTFAATVEAIALRGATPVFVDIEEESFNMDWRLLEAAISTRTRAILPVHLYGLPADMNPIMELARQYGLRVIEDNAQAIGGTYQGSPTGSFGDLSCISFYPTKNLGACGDAGMIVTSDDSLKRRLQSLRAHGMERRYYHDELGVNSRLDELQATILTTKLAYLNGWNHRRNQIASLYAQRLATCPGITLPSAGDHRSTHVWHQYTIRVHSNTPAAGSGNAARDWLAEELKARGIGTMCYYPVPLHMQKAFATLGHQKGAFPITEKLADEVLSLPMYPELTDEQVTFVCDSINEIMHERSVPSPLAVSPFLTT